MLKGDLMSPFDCQKWSKFLWNHKMQWQNYLFFLTFLNIKHLLCLLIIELSSNLMSISLNLLIISINIIYNLLFRVCILIRQFSFTNYIKHNLWYEFYKSSMVITICWKVLHLKLLKRVLFWNTPKCWLNKST